MATSIIVRSDGTPLNQAALTDVKALWSVSKAKSKQGESRLFYGVGRSKQTVCALGIGDQDPKTDIEKREVSRKLAATAAKQLGDLEEHIKIDPVYSPHAAATGAHLALFAWDLKTSEKAKAALAKSRAVKLELSTDAELQELPANLCTPTIFCERAQELFKDHSSVTVNVHDADWAKRERMNMFLSVAAGSHEPCKFLEVVYEGAPEKQRIAFVGKGITFDSGGITLKPGADMKAMRSDMGGAANLLCALHAIVKLKLPLNIVFVAPLTENMPGGKATKPGDVFTARSGKTVEVDNTDAEGRLVLGDALNYVSTKYRPSTIIDAATLTGAAVIALGKVYASVHSNSDELWQELEAAGKAEHDRFWRMPFDEDYIHYLSETSADLCNVGPFAGDGAIATMFLREHVDGLACNSAESDAVDTVRWAHIDTTPVMQFTKTLNDYERVGMSGRPVRAIIEWAQAGHNLLHHCSDNSLRVNLALGASLPHAAHRPALVWEASCDAHTA
ncbi:uncharacterized protein L969DRAFT_93403 [Mixia osmundae IAM 14324]|uniref:Cytosol aminopeptidase domain-containing protein n=1 Tax=Mixia osmundae (strain CBS 9802 / IAM 14324 / JCM 22182 / KY 12970) TaxID=764103 RepID=G7EAQ2_MIXOS|nr:uncharacterized protein L969DRAFT_93403 [Mixia osmundae IAM 14324]KEI40881.1 hypothetical protein L969DRAFT_93403 [Mixia osmundae IAM 14324]GAA99912.1 hypothetical protein E5Q_06615 [Mixia osmundae IAM 14324]